MALHAVTVVLATLVVFMGTKGALAKLQCAYNSVVATQKNVGVNDLEGTWYTVYSSESQAEVSKVLLVKTTLKEDVKLGQPYIESDRELVQSKGDCSRSGEHSYRLNASQGYMAMPSVQGEDGIYDSVIYVLGVDSQVLLAYSKLRLDGSNHKNFVFVMTKDPSKSVTLTSTMQSNVNALCGGTAAASLSSYTTVNVDKTATCAE